LDKTTIKGFQEGCTNSDKKGNTTRGTEYYQSHLKKLRNTLSDQTCRDIIKGNVANPEDFFRQEEEKRHTSTSPIYLTSTLILESTRPNDVVVDIWNGVGNTMTSALLLNRKYIGVEMEDNYFQQSVRRLITTEQWLSEVTKEVKNTLKEYTGEITPSSEFSISIPVEQVYVES
jgi:DNA modification methylase